jgi:hypothetical protein
VENFAKTLRSAARQTTLMWLDWTSSLRQQRLQRCTLQRRPRQAAQLHVKYTRLSLHSWERERSANGKCWKDFFTVHKNARVHHVAGRAECRHLSSIWALHEQCTRVWFVTFKAIITTLPTATSSSPWVVASAGAPLSDSSWQLTTTTTTRV